VELWFLESEREEKERKKVTCWLRARQISRSSGHPNYILEVSFAGPLDLASLKRLPEDISAQTNSGLPQLPMILHKTSLFHPCMRDPECQHNY
jgi:hypothetical protein